jgi:hypothetical protein
MFCYEGLVGLILSGEYGLFSVHLTLYGIVMFNVYMAAVTT